MIKPGAIYELAPDGRVMLEMQDVMDMVADVRRLEWLVKNGWDVRFSKKDWRDAIDEAMRGGLVSRENWNINDWKIRCSELAFEVRDLREAIAGLMKLTSAAYGSQVTEVPEYVAALKAMRGE